MRSCWVLHGLWRRRCGRFWALPAAQGTLSAHRCMISAHWIPSGFGYPGGRGAKAMLGHLKRREAWRSPAKLVFALSSSEGSGDDAARPKALDAAPQGSAVEVPSSGDEAPVVGAGVGNWLSVLSALHAARKTAAPEARRRLRRQPTSDDTAASVAKPRRVPAMPAPDGTAASVAKRRRTSAAADVATPTLPTEAAAPQAACRSGWHTPGGQLQGVFPPNSGGSGLGYLSECVLTPLSWHCARSVFKCLTGAARVPYPSCTGVAPVQYQRSATVVTAEYQFRTGVVPECSTSLLPARYGCSTAIVPTAALYVCRTSAAYQHSRTIAPLSYQCSTSVVPM